MLEAASGSAFDPEVVAACVHVFRKGGFNLDVDDEAT
jgi:hypothetical protein